MDNEKNVKELTSTVKAFTDWLGTNSDGYLMLVSKGDKAILAAKGDTDRIVMGLVFGCMRNKRAHKIIQDAGKIIENKEHSGHANWQERMIPQSLVISQLWKLVRQTLRLRAATCMTLLRSTAAVARALSMPTVRG